MAASSSSKSAINNRHSTIVIQHSSFNLFAAVTVRQEACRGIYARCAGAEISPGGGDGRMVLVVSGAAGFYRPGIGDQAAGIEKRVTSHALHP